MDKPIDTLDKLMAVLRSRPLPWKLDGKGIRANLNGSLHCPLTAACEIATGERFGVGAYHNAAATMGMPFVVAECIGYAADGEETPSSYSAACRRRLLTLVKRPGRRASR